MSKQKLPDSRKGLISKSATEDIKKVKTLKIDREIDDESLWHVSINDGISISKRPCKKSSLQDSFNLQNRSWNVKVIGCWVKMNGRGYIEF